MKKQERAAVIILNKDKILLMHRHKNGHEYYALPGGTIEPNERPEQTAVREIKEETNLDIILDKLLWQYDDGIAYCHYFLAKEFSGQTKLGGPELAQNNPKNHYALKWVELKNLNNILLYPEKIKNEIIKSYSI